MSPHPLPLHASIPSPSNLSAQPGERATGLQVIELLGGKTGQGFLRECFWLPALGEGLGEGV